MAADRLSLLAKVGELVVAFDATQVFQIHMVADLSARQIETNLWAIDLDRQTIPGWDLGELFQYGAMNKSWVLVDAVFRGAEGTTTRRLGLRVGACITVRKLPDVKKLPGKMYPGRPGAISGAFAAGAIEELGGSPSGVVLDLAYLLAPHELEAGGRVARSHGA